MYHFKHQKVLSFSNTKTVFCLYFRYQESTVERLNGICFTKTLLFHLTRIRRYLYSIHKEDFKILHCIFFLLFIIHEVSSNSVIFTSIRNLESDKYKYFKTERKTKHKKYDIHSQWSKGEQEFREKR